jgi:hypothetical protein
MFSSKRIKLVTVSVAVAVAAAGIGIGVASSASASAARPASAAAAAAPARAAHHAPQLSIARFDLTGWVIDAKYTLGRNTGNTFEQTYSSGGIVQGVPIAGPFVGVKFPPEDYVALPVGHDQLYVSWLDPSGNFAIVDAFVFNFKTRTVTDYAPGSASPESVGTITVVHRGVNRIP